jgi:hypothetical protein
MQTNPFLTASDYAKIIRYKRDVMDTNISLGFEQYNYNIINFDKIYLEVNYYIRSPLLACKIYFLYSNFSAWLHACAYNIYFAIL